MSACGAAAYPNEQLGNPPMQEVQRPRPRALIVLLTNPNIRNLDRRAFSGGGSVSGNATNQDLAQPFQVFLHELVRQIMALEKIRGSNTHRSHC